LTLLADALKVCGRPLLKRLQPHHYVVVRDGWNDGFGGRPTERTEQFT
jgi:hypothetical protein